MKNYGWLIALAAAGVAFFLYRRGAFAGVLAPASSPPLIVSAPPSTPPPLTTPKPATNINDVYVAGINAAGSIVTSIATSGSSTSKPADPTQTTQARAATSAAKIP